MGKESQYVKLKSSLQNGMDNILLLLLKMCMYIEKRLENMSVYSDSGIMSEFLFYTFLVSQLSMVISLLSLTKKPTPLKILIDKFDTIGSNILHESYTFWILLAISCRMI